MRVKLLSVVLVFLATNSYAQFDFAGNASYKKIETGADSIFQISKSYDFEFRLYSLGAFPPFRSLFILAVKNGVYSARVFKMERVDSARWDWVELNIPGKNVEKLWFAIHRNHVFDLPPFQKIHDENEDIPMPKDGISYSVEYSTRDKINGALYYRCPRSLAKLYPKIKPVVQIAEIIRLVYEFIGKGWKPC